MRGQGLQTLAILLIGLLFVGCGGGEPEVQEVVEEPDPEETMQAARAESLAMAEAKFEPAAFDSISWANSEARFERGDTVFSFSCSDCHGSGGRGDGDVALRYEITMPDFTKVDWDYAGDIPTLRHRIFVGHESEMPNWGLHGLAYRDIDAVAFYLDEVFGGSEAAE